MIMQDLDLLLTLNPPRHYSTHSRGTEKPFLIPVQLAHTDSDIAAESSCQLASASVCALASMNRCHQLAFSNRIAAVCLKKADSMCSWFLQVDQAAGSGEGAGMDVDTEGQCAGINQYKVKECGYRPGYKQALTSRTISQVCCIPQLIRQVLLRP